MLKIVKSEAKLNTVGAQRPKLVDGSDAGKALNGVVGIADTLKPDAVVTVRRLQNMNIDVHLVTGDNIHTALHFARLVGIPSVSLLRF